MTELYIVTVLLVVALGIAIIDIMKLEKKIWNLKDRLEESEDKVRQRDAIVDLFTDMRD